MGVNSYKCKITGKPLINSDNLIGEPAHLFLLESGVVIEYMYGNYPPFSTTS